MPEPSGAGPADEGDGSAQELQDRRGERFRWAKREAMPCLYFNRYKTVY